MKNYLIHASIDCALCAKKVENSLKECKDISYAAFDFNKKLLQVKTTLSLDEIKRLCKACEDDIVFLDENNYTFKVDIDCPVCAKKVEDALKNNDMFQDASFSFERKRLKVKTYLTQDEVKELCKRVEDDINFLSEVKDESKDYAIYKISISLVLLLLGFITSYSPLFIISYLICGYDILIKALKNIVKGRIFDENFLMSAATISALIISSFSEAAAVMIFYQIGEYFQRRAVNKSRSSIEKLLEINTKVALLDNGKSERVENIKVGDVIVVRNGEKVALDGTIIEGSSIFDTKMITGESLPVELTVNDEITSGYVNLNSVIKVRVDRPYNESTIKKIIDLIQYSDNRKSQSERFLTCFCKYYTPLVCLLALLIATIPPIVLDESFIGYIYKAMQLLVISCPCALVLSIPLSYFASIGAFAKEGVLVKGSYCIEKLSHLKQIAFDKTGTLTKGEIAVSEVVNLTELNILPYLASAEKNSTHPFAKAITSYYKGELLNVESIREMPGFGLEAIIDNKKYIIGNNKLFKEKVNTNKSVVIIGTEDRILGYVTFTDSIKPNAKESLAALRALGCENIIMLSGDKKENAKEIATQLSLDDYKAELLPDEKLREFEKFMKAGVVTAYCGDGVNDVPTLKLSDIGISMGNKGSDAAIESSEMIILSDDLSKISKSVKISIKTERIVRENVVISLLIKALIILLAILGYSSLYLAIFADVGVAIIAVLNAMRCSKTKSIK